MQDQFLTLTVALLTIASPIGVSVVKKKSWSNTMKVATPVILSFLLAGAYAYFSGMVNGMGIIPAFLIVYGLQQLAYTTMLKSFTTWVEANVNTDQNDVAIGKYEQKPEDEGW